MPEMSRPSCKIFQFPTLLDSVPLRYCDPLNQYLPGSQYEAPKNLRGVGPPYIFP